MDSLPTSDSAPEGSSAPERSGGNEAGWLRFWSSGGERIAGPPEWTACRIEVNLGPEEPESSGWMGLELTRNGSGLPLRQEKIAGRPRITARWPRSGPGRYELVLQGGEARREVEIVVDPSKISRPEFAQLLEDLEARLPTQIAIGLQEAGGLSGIELREPGDTTLEQELIRLRRATEGTGRRTGLTKALRRLSDRPHQVLERTKEWRRRGRARRPLGSDLGKAMTRPGNLEDGMPKEVPDAQAERTPDVYENRLVRQFARQVELRLRRLLPVLRGQNTESARESAEKAERILSRLERSRRRATFLQEVSLPKRPPSRASQVLQKRPIYRDVLEGYLEFRREISVRLSAPELEAPLRNLPNLYQVWCTLHVIQAVVQSASRLGYRIDQRSRETLTSKEGGFFTLSLGDTKVDLVHPGSGTEIRLRAERTYPQGSSGLHSSTYAQRPDLAVEVYPQGDGPSVLLFDPKYKLGSRGGEEGSSEDVSSEGGSSGRDSAKGSAGPGGSPLKADIDKMHAYRDAIRSPDGTRVVEKASILYPGESRVFGGGVSAVQALPGQSEKLRSAIEGVFREILPEAEASTGAQLDIGHD
jgi:hypothetical protein